MKGDGIPLTPASSHSCRVRTYFAVRTGRSRAARRAGKLLASFSRRPISMSRDDEDRILHGLYYHRESIDEEVLVTGDQVLWLAMHPLPEGEAWNKDGQLQSVDASAFPAEVQSKLVTAKLELPLRY